MGAGACCLLAGSYRGLGVTHVCQDVVMKLLVVLVLLSWASAQECPPVPLQQAFNITKYAGLWYGQMQQPVVYLPPWTNYCVTANYTITSPTTVGVYNYANSFEVNGPAKGGPLCAVVKDPSQPSKLSVGPCALSPDNYGPYWVLKTGPSDAKQYEYTLLSGGQPTVSTGNGCRTGFGVNGSGLWILTREPQPSGDIVQSLVQYAQSIGFDTSVLRPIEQEGCKYAPVA